MKKTDSLLRSTSLFSLATLISRVLGVARDSSIAACLPRVWQDIFWAGIKIPSTFRQLFAEGSLSAAFIPLLSGVIEKEGEDKARETAHAIFNLLALVVSVVILAAILLAPWIVPYILAFPSEKTADCVIADWRVGAGVQVTQIMFPFLFFVALAAWAMGVLNTHRRFFMPAVASSFFNVCVVAGAVTGAAVFHLADMPMMWYMGGAVIFGGFLQFAVQLPQARQLRYFPPKAVSPFHPKVKIFLRMLAPTVFGLAIYQINALITQTYFASKFGEGGISITQYAFRLIQFPLGIIGVALATASFPQIAQQIAQEKHAQAARTLTEVMKYLLLLMIPAAVGLIALGRDINGVIYDHGEFHKSAWLEPTVQVLNFYCLGLFFYAVVQALVRTSQAHRDFRTPVYSGAAGVIVNIALCKIFVDEGMPLWSLALASSIASGVNSLYLLISLRRRMEHFLILPLAAYALRVLLASALMGLACALFAAYFPIAGGTFARFTIRVVLGIGLGLGVYGLCGWFLFRDELKRLLKMQ
ncbi:MAG: murein biosynthesis integral membrane protein MurJ [Candidatus Omnitrophota bacterium]